MRASPLAIVPPALLHFHSFEKVAWGGLAHALFVSASASGLLHDMGELSVPDEILNTQAALSDEEYEIVKRHSE